MEMSEDGSSLKLGNEHCDFAVAGAAITNCYRLGLQHSRVSGGQTSESKVLAGPRCL